MNKKYLLVIIVILIVTFVAMLYLFQGRSKDEGLSQEKINNLNQLLPKISCDFANNAEAFQKAIENVELGYCDCIDKEIVKTNCKETVSDVTFFNQAIAQYDGEICENIKNQDRKENCQKLVVSTKAQLKRENPQQLANIFLSSGNYEGAIEAFQDLSDQSPEDVEILSSLALAYANEALIGGKSQLASEALDIIDEAIALDGNNAELFRVKGFVYEVVPDFPQAIVSYDRALDIDPEYVLAYAGRGHAHNLLGILDKALEDFEKAKELDGDRNFVDVYTNLCRLQSTRGDLLERAVENCLIVVESEDISSVRKSSSYQILSDIYLKLGRDEEAYNQLKMAEALSPSDANVDVSLARYYIYKQDWENAQKYSQMAIEEDEMKSVAYGVLSYALYQQAEFDQAIAMAQKGLEKIDSDISLFVSNRPAEKRNMYLTLANIYHQMGDQANEKKYKEMADDVFSE